jgi:hypothetical protein
MELSASIEGKIETCDEQTQIISIKCNDFNVSLHKTYTSGALYRVEGSDDEGKYESIIYLSHFDGQECKEYIRSIPTLLEKLFKVGECEVSIKDSNMICEFETDLMSVKLTLPKVMETQIEMMAKTISRHEKRISELEKWDPLFCSHDEQIGNLKEENKQLGNMIKGLTAQTKALENIVMELKHGNKILGKWILKTSQQEWAMFISRNGDSFILQRCHLGDTVFHPLNMRWEDGIFYWDVLKVHNHTTDSNYRFNPRNPDVIIEINGSAQNILCREPFDPTNNEFIPPQIIGKWKTEDGSRSVDIKFQNNKFVVNRPGTDASRTNSYRIARDCGKNWSFIIHFDHFHYHCSSTMPANTIIEKDSGTERIFVRDINNSCPQK